MKAPSRYLQLGLALLLCGLALLPVIALVLGVAPYAVWQALADPEVWQAVVLSVGCASLSTLLGLFFGVGTALLFVRGHFPGRPILRGLFDLLQIVPQTVLGIGLLLVFARQRPLGAFIEDVFGVRMVSAWPGIVLGMFVNSVPLIIKYAEDGFRSVPRQLERVAISLGCTPRQAFFRVTLPLARPYLASGALLAWARSVSAFGVVMVVAYFPLTAPVLIWERFSAYGLQEALAPSVILMSICLIIFSVVQAISYRIRRPSERER